MFVLALFSVLITYPWYCSCTKLLDTRTTCSLLSVVLILCFPALTWNTPEGGTAKMQCPAVTTHWEFRADPAQKCWVFEADEPHWRETICGWDPFAASRPPTTWGKTGVRRPRKGLSENRINNNLKKDLRQN